MYTPLNKTWFIVTFISQLTSEANPPRSTILGDSYASSTNQPHPHSPSSNADAATNSTPYTPPSLSSSYVPLLPSPFTLLIFLHFLFLLKYHFRPNLRSPHHLLLIRTRHRLPKRFIFLYFLRTKILILRLNLRIRFRPKKYFLLIFTRRRFPRKRTYLFPVLTLTRLPRTRMLQRTLRLTRLHRFLRRTYHFFLRRLIRILFFLYFNLIPLSTESSQSAPSPFNSHSPSPAETFYFPVFSSDQNPYSPPEPTNTFPSKEVFPSDPYTTSFSTEAD
ncbi:hypothetical protein pdam_00002694, partial [Pocillopora damicornis]